MVADSPTLNGDEIFSVADVGCLDVFILKLILIFDDSPKV